MRLRKTAATIPFLIFLGLLLILYTVIRLSSQTPQIREISPQSGAPGEVLSVSGKHFGSDRSRSWIRISGHTPTASSYLEWTNTRIGVRIPEDVSSGLVYVYTQHGRSNGVLFTNKNHVPQSAGATVNPEAPLISSVTPQSAAVGDLVTLDGRRFGESGKTGRVYFTWKEGGSDSAGEGESEWLATPESEYGYDAWSGRQIQVRVPDGAASGQIMVETDKGRSAPIPFQVDNQVGAKSFVDRHSYAVHYRVEIDRVQLSDSQTAGNNKLYVWLPKVPALPSQRNPQLLSAAGSPLFSDIDGMLLYELDGLEESKTYSLSRTVLFDRYATETTIIAQRVPDRYKMSSRFMDAFTAAGPYIPADNAEIRSISRRVAGRNPNPYRAARVLYNYVVDRLEPVQRVENITAVNGLDARGGNAFTYASAFTALMRAAGVPTRIVAGYVVGKTGTLNRHYWAEYYLQGFGWVPVDPALGDGMYPDTREVSPENPREYYFGSIDSGHITFSRGVRHGRRLSPDGRPKQVGEMYSLQTTYLEAVGNLSYYRSRWFDATLLGQY